MTDTNVPNRTRAWLAYADVRPQSLIEKDQKPAPLSVVLIETVFLGLVLTLGTSTFVTWAAQWRGISFSVYRLINVYVILSCVAGTLVLRWKKIRAVADRDYATLASLLLLGTVLAGLAAIAQTSSSDSVYYVSNVVYFRDHPQAPMDFAIHFLVGNHGETIISPFQGTSVSYDYFRGVIASLLNVDFLNLYYLSGSFVGFILPLVYFLLVYRFAQDSRRALIGAAFCIAAVLIFSDAYPMARFSFWFSFYGKFLLLPVGLPLYTALSLKFYASPSAENWLFLSATSMALAGMTATAMLLLPLLSVILFLAAVLAAVRIPGVRERWKQILVTGAAYFSSLALLCLYALSSILATLGGGISGNPFELHGLQTFSEHLAYFSGGHPILTALIILVSLILSQLFLAGWPRRLILFWAALLILLLLNPAAMAVLLDVVVPRNIYWRLFALLPFPLALGLVLMERTARFPRMQAALALGALVLGTAIYGLMTNRAGILSFSLVSPHDENLNLARQVAEIAPPGPMLAPPSLSLLIPIVDGFHPQIAIRPDGMRLWLDPVEANLRLGSTRLMNGGMQYGSLLGPTLRRVRVRSVVILTTNFRAEDLRWLQAVLRTNKFVHRRVVGPYLVFWR